MKACLSAADSLSNTALFITKMQGEYTCPVSDRFFCTWSNLAEMMTDSGFSCPSTVPCCRAVNTSGKAIGVVMMPSAL